MRIPFSFGRRGSITSLYAVILVLGFFWCRDVLGRLSEDIQTMKEGVDKAEKNVVVFYWVITAGIMALMGYSAWAIVSKLIDFIK